MATITKIEQLDLDRTYSYADYLTWQFDEMLELIKFSFNKETQCYQLIKIFANNGFSSLFFFLNLVLDLQKVFAK